MKLTRQFACGLAALVLGTISLRGQEAAAPRGFGTAAQAAESPAAGVSDEPVYGSIAKIRTANRLATPQMILTQSLSESVQQELTEDLQVMDRLLLRAIGGDAVQSGPYTRVLGVLVNNRDESRSRIQFIQGVGVVFRYQVGISVSPQTSPELDGDEEEDQDSDWEATRRELFEAPASYTATIRGRRKPVTYNEEVVSTMRSRVTEALQNVARIRHMDEANRVAWPGRGPSEPGVVVLIECEQDGTAMTMVTSVSAINEGGDSAVQTHQYRQDVRPQSAYGTDYYRYLDLTVPGGATSFGVAPNFPGALPAPTPSAPTEPGIVKPPAGGDKFFAPKPSQPRANGSGR